MKGIVMEIHKDKVIVLTKDGSFLEVNRGNRILDIGQEIIIDTNKNLRRQIIRRFVSVAAVFILLLTTGYGVYGYYTPYGYVNVDINPSVELAYNLYNRVIDIKGLNEDGDILISKVKDYRNKPIEKVINEVVDRAVEEDYVKPQEENVILITVTEKKNNINEEKIYKSVDKHIKEKVKNTQVVLMEGDNKIYEKAKKDKLSPGKLMLIQKAIDLNKDIKFEEVAKKPVREIMKIIKEAKKELKKFEKEKSEKMKPNKDKLGDKIRRDKEENVERKELIQKEIEEHKQDKIDKMIEKKEIKKDKVNEIIEKIKNRYIKSEKKQEEIKERREKEKDTMVDDNAKGEDEEDKDTDDKLEDENKSKRRYENKYKHDKKEQYKDKEEDKDKNKKKDKDED